MREEKRDTAECQKRRLAYGTNVFWGWGGTGGAEKLDLGGNQSTCVCGCFWSFGDRAHGRLRKLVCYKKTPEVHSPTPCLETSALHHHAGLEAWANRKVLSEVARALFITSCWGIRALCKYFGIKKNYVYGWILLCLCVLQFPWQELLGFCWYCLPVAPSDTRNHFWQIWNCAFPT